MNKKVGYTIIIVVSALYVIALIAFFTSIFISMKNEKNTRFNHHNTEYTITKKYNYSEINTANIDLINTNINIITSNTDYIFIAGYSGDGEKIAINNYNGNLTIKETSKTKVFNYPDRKKTINIHIPKIFEKDIKINTINGDIKLVGAITFKNFNANSANGDIELGNITVDNSTIRNISGDIQIDSLLGNATISAASSDVEIKNLNIKDKVDIKTISGEVEAKINGECKINANSISGEIENYKTSTNTNKILEVKTTSGDISLR